MRKSAAGSRWKNSSEASVVWGSLGLRFASMDTKKAAGETGRRWRRGSFALLGFQFREPFENERVRLIGQLGDQRQIIPTEAVGVVVIPGFVHVGPGEGYVEDVLLGGFVFP